MTDNGFTPTEQAVLSVLDDGLLHSREELKACLPDEMSDYETSNYKALSVHLTNIRRKLRPRGHDIVCCLRNRRIYYRHILTLRTQS